MPESQFTETDPAYIIADLNARIRALESKYNILTERLLVINQNMIEEYKKLMKDIRQISAESKKTSMGINSTQEVVKDVVKEMRIFAKKDEVKVLEKYIDMLNILQLVTDEQLEKRLEKFKLEGTTKKIER